MPTGYTAAIYDDISFEDFALNCARRFGATIHMRDSPNGNKITLRKSSDHHKEGLIEAEKELLDLKGLSEAAITARCIGTNNERYAAYVKRENKRLTELAKLLNMRDKVSSWEIPSEEHRNMKEFMIRQIDETIEHDCRAPDNFVNYVPKKWYDDMIENAKWSIDYHIKHLNKETESVNSSNKWIIDLYKSLGKDFTTE